MILARDPGPVEDERVAPNVDLEKVITAVQDARDRIHLDDGGGLYEPPWSRDPWGPRSPLSEAQAALEWVLDLAKEARP